MKAYVAKFLIVICLFSFTPLKEVVKIPMLFVHFYHHIQECPDMTVSDFIDMHYMQGNVFDEDYAKDMQLPFKVMDFTLIPAFIFQEIKEVEIPKKITSFILKNKLNTTYTFHLSDAKLSGIFHPPRFV